MSRTKRMVAGGALLVAGFGAGAAAMVAGSAFAEDPSAPTTSAAAEGMKDPSQSVRADETLLTGSVAARVTEAALAQYPDATIQRVETDSDGVYEAHVVTTDGQEMIVQVGKDFTETGTQTGGDRGGHHGDGPDDATDSD